MIESLIDPQVLQALSDLKPLVSAVGPWIIPIVSGLASLFGKLAARKSGKAEPQANLQDQFAYGQLQHKQFNPMAPFERARKGRLYAALARTWGLDKILGEKYLQHIENYSSYPGTQAIGGGMDLTTPQASGLTVGDRSAGGRLGMLSDIFGGITTAFGQGLGAIGDGSTTGTVPNLASAPGNLWDLQSGPVGLSRISSTRNKWAPPSPPWLKE